MVWRGVSKECMVEELGEGWGGVITYHRFYSEVHLSQVTPGFEMPGKRRESSPVRFPTRHLLPLPHPQEEEGDLMLAGRFG